MLMTASRRGVVIRTALMTPLCLIGTFFVGALLGDLLFAGLPGNWPDEGRVALAALPVLICVGMGGALWGRALARVAHVDDAKRMMWAGALGYAPTLVVVALTLTVLEKLIVEQGRGPDLPLHVVFTLLFTPAVFLIAAMGTLAVGLALKQRGFTLRLALSSGLVAGMTFLVVDLLMDSFGYRVGAPGAVQRATMLTVLLIGDVTASLAAGTVIGWFLSGRREA